MRQAILDSDIFSELLAQHDPVIAGKARAYLGQFGNFIVSALTFFEVQKGLTYRPKPRISKSLTELMRDLVVLPVRKEEAELGGTIHGLLKQQGRPIGEIDPIIAATAISYGLPLATGNTSHYQVIVGLGFPLELENWREP